MLKNVCFCYTKSHFKEQVNCTEYIHSVSVRRMGSWGMLECVNKQSEMAIRGLGLIQIEKYYQSFVDIPNG